MSVGKTNPSLDRTTELQSKLYQAAIRDRGRRFHALYDKLYLPYILQSAWESVRGNNGAAGIDQQTLAEVEAAGVPQFLAEIAQALRERTYWPLPVRRVEIPKGEGKTRPLGIPTVRDRVVQAAAKLVLEPIFEADFEETSFGFRPGRGQLEALEAVAENARKGFRWVVDADIEQFFDTLDHEQLMAALRRRISDGEMLRLIYRWLKAGYLQDGEYHDNDRGSPQGGVLSPLLANIYLHRLDKAHRHQKAFIGRLTRYADDFVIQCGSREAAYRALAWVKAQVEGMKLRLHPDKTRVVSDQEGFEFLGFHHQRLVLETTQRETHGVYRWPGKKAQQRFRERVRQIIGPPMRVRKRWGAVKQDLKRYLAGWCQYYRHGQSSRILARLDRDVNERVARNFARSQPKGKQRQPRRWQTYRDDLLERQLLPLLSRIAKQALPAYRGAANVRWRAV